MTTKQFNRIYSALVLVMAAGIGLVIGGSITKLLISSMTGIVMLLGGFTACVVLYTIETNKHNTK